MKYDNNSIYVDDKEINLKGLNTSHVIWHLSEMCRPEMFIENFNDKYSMPNKIHCMSLAEGTDFDALLVDDKMFRYTKLTEDDRNEVQEYINKYAYASALLKLNECSTVLGSGLDYNYSLDESYKFVSGSYDKLFMNTTITKEKGRLIESFGSDNKVNIYEGEKNYLIGNNDKRLCEDWSVNFKLSNINDYHVSSIEESDGLTILNIVDKEGKLYEAQFDNVNNKLIEMGINLDMYLKERNLVNVYRIGTLLEYQEPFTIKSAVLLSCDVEGDKAKLGMLDAFGNRGIVEATLNISPEKFKKKYQGQIDEILNTKTFDDRLDLTELFFEDAQKDIAKLSKIKGRQVVDKEIIDGWNKLSYKIKGYVPAIEEAEDNDKEVVSIDNKDRSKFNVLVFRSEDNKPYQIKYSYTYDEPIENFIQEINDRIEDGEWGFDTQTDIINFYKELNNYGTVLGSYPRGIATAGRKQPKNEEDILEAEGVQVGDIAPKVDQEVGGLVTVKFKKRKKNESFDFDKNDLLINSINEEDEFYGARGFIKDELGRYHFNDYYIVEGKVVHKSKLTESTYTENKDKQIKITKDIIKKIEDKIGNVDEYVATPIWSSRGYCTHLIKADNNTVNVDVTYFYKNDLYDEGTIEIEVSPNIAGYNINNRCYVTLFYKSVGDAVEGAYNAVKIAREIVKADDNKKDELSKQLKNIKESFNPEGYTKVIKAINDGIENDEDKEALKDYLQNIIGYCRSIADDNEVLVESLFKDTAGAYGIKTYFDMIYGQEPDSEYARIIQQYMNTHDEIRKKIKKLEDKYESGKISLEERNKEHLKLRDEDMKNTELLYKADKIPEDERGQMYKDFLEIEKANNDDFAQRFGYKDYDEYEKAIGFGLDSDSNYQADEDIKKYVSEE